MAQKFITAAKKRSDHSVLSFFVVALALLITYALYRYTELQVQYMPIPLGVAALIAAILHFTKPQRIVPKKPLDSLDPDEKAFFKVIKRQWVKVTRDTGLSKEEKQEDGSIYVHVPKILSVESHPLGLKMCVQPLPGYSAEKMASQDQELASALGVEIRTKRLGPAEVQVIAELRDSLEGVRKVTTNSDDCTEIVIGRLEDGGDAKIDLTDASHVIMQGMTRSGKSALCYTIFSQLVGLKNINLWGIDPNKVLLEPLGLATNPQNFVVGNDPVAALELLKRFTELMDENLNILSQRRIEAFKDFTEETPLQVMILEEYPGLVRQAEKYDKSVSTKERITPILNLLLGRLVSEGAKAGIRVVLIAQRASSAIIDTDNRGQFGTRITMGVDNGDAVRMLHPQATPELIDAVTGEDFPVGRCLFWKHRKQRIMQADFTPYEDYLDSLNLPMSPEPQELTRSGA